MDFLARVVEGRKQGLFEHLVAVAELCEGFFPIGELKGFACVAGLLHDVGKFRREFQDYLRAGERRRGEVEHSAAGAAAAERLLAAKNAKATARILAYCISAHHTHLPCCRSYDANVKSSLEMRVKRGRGYLEEIPGEVWDWLVSRLPAVDDSLLRVLVTDGDRYRTAFSLQMFVRMLFSCLVDADRLDAESFENPDAQRLRAYPPLGALWERFDERYRAAFSAKRDSSELNRLRWEIFESCLAASEGEPGIYTLTVPTGGGKTLASLAFALRHAIKHNMRRIIYVIPYTSIIEQNAAVFRWVLGGRSDPHGAPVEDYDPHRDFSDCVVEHHSNFEAAGRADELSRWELAVENWDAPVIVTTNVQFFESLFAAGASRARKVHNVAKSVVILDEAQMLPVRLLLPTLRALEELSQRYGCTVVLCTATQPAIAKSEDFPDGIEVRGELGEASGRLSVEGIYAKLRRTTEEFLGDLTRESLVERILSHRSVLCIVNTRRRARELFEALRAAEEEREVFHLSSLMCPVHRSAVLDEVRRRLLEEKPTTLVSTQVVEAGVDIDFPVVFREIAGIDSIAQAAGRCNREGRLGPQGGRVFIFRAREDGGNWRKGLPTLIEEAAEVTDLLLRTGAQDPLAPETIRMFFENYIWSLSRGGERLSKLGQAVLDEMAAGVCSLDFSFPKIEESFRVIDDAKTFSVVVPWGDEGKKLFRELQHVKDKGLIPDRALLRKAQKFSVNVYAKEQRNLDDYLEPFPDRERILFYMLSPELVPKLYDPHTGLLVDWEGGGGIIV